MDEILKCIEHSETAKKGKDVSLKQKHASNSRRLSSSSQDHTPESTSSSEDGVSNCDSETNEPEDAIKKMIVSMIISDFNSRMIETETEPQSLSGHGVLDPACGTSVGHLDKNDEVEVKGSLLKAFKRL